MENSIRITRCLLILVIIVFMCGYVNAQSWFPVGYPGFSSGASKASSIVIDKNGIPYVLYLEDADSDYATVMKFSDNTWQPLGSEGLVLFEFTPSIAIDHNGIPYVAYSYGSGVGTVENYISGNWQLVMGTSPLSWSAFGTSIAIDTGNTPYVAYQDANYNYRATVKKFNDTGWVILGNEGFSAVGTKNITIAIDKNGTPYIAYQNDTFPNYSFGSGPVTVMKYNGSSWVTVGLAGFSAGKADFPSLAIDSSGTPYVVYSDSVFGYKATVMKFIDTAWVSVGTPGFSAGRAQYTTIAINPAGMPYVTYEDGGNNNKATVMKYNGSSWGSVGTAGFSDGGVQFTSITIDTGGTFYVVYSDSVKGNKTTVMKYGWPEQVTNTSNTWSALTAFPNPSHGSFTLHVSTSITEDAQIIITNVVGEKVKELTATTNTDIPVQLDTPPGIYFISAITTQGTQTSKMVVW